MSYTLRRPTLKDAPALLALMCACDIEAIGNPDTTLGDVIDELSEPDLDLDADAWLATDASGAAVGCALVMRRGDADMIDLEIYVRPETGELWPSLWDLAEARAIEIGRQLGHPEVRLDLGIHRSDERQRAVAAGRDYAPIAAFYRMRADHQETVAPPALPAGFTLDAVGDDDRLRRAAVEIERRSFAQHFGFAERTFEWWEAKFAASSTSSWEMLRVLAVDGVPAGVVLASDQYVEDENCGYVQTLGVLEEFRGRGVGRHLLLDAFARDSRAGRVGTILHVDANNVTPALGLYESVGMRQVLVIDNWRKTVSL